jgi:Zn-dependent protease
MTAIMADMLNGDFSLVGLLSVVVVLIVSITIHEMMHALVGFKLGDDTAMEHGRISLNPLNHIDPFMTIILPAISLLLFHVPILAAKPVPFNPERLKFDEFGAALVAAAGPVSNLVLAALGAIVIHLANVGSGFAGELLADFIIINVGLFVFNLIPIPPLDGSRVLYAFAPDPVRNFMNQIEPLGLFLVFGIVLLGGFDGFLGNLNSTVLNWLI